MAPVIDLYCIAFGFEEKKAQMLLAEKLRRFCPDIVVVTHCGEGSFKNQLKKADKSGARFALVTGEEELENNTVTLKPLRERSEQKAFSVDDLAALAAAITR